MDVFWNLESSSFDRFLGWQVYFDLIGNHLGGGNFLKNISVRLTELVPYL